MCELSGVSEFIVDFFAKNLQSLPNIALHSFFLQLSFFDILTCSENLYSKIMSCKKKVFQSCWNIEHNIWFVVYFPKKLICVNKFWRPHTLQMFIKNLNTIKQD